MFQKYIKRSLLLLTLALVSNTIWASPDSFLVEQHQLPNAFFKNKPWGFLEEKFIVEPEKTSSSIFSQGCRLLASSLASGVTTWGVNSALERIAVRMRDNNGNIPTYLKTPLRQLQAGLSGGASFLGAYVLSSRFTEKKIDPRLLEEFVSSWPIYKEYTPLEMRDGFEELYKLYREKGVHSLRNVAIPTITHIRRRVYESFPIKYAERLRQDGDSLSGRGRNFFDYRFLNASLHFDAERILRSLWDIGKEMYQEAKKATAH